MHGGVSDTIALPRLLQLRRCVISLMPWTKTDIESNPPEHPDETAFCSVERPVVLFTVSYCR